MEENYQKILTWYREKFGELPTDQAVRMLHDLWCPTWYGKECECQPNLFVGDSEVLYPKEILR